MNTNINEFISRIKEFGQEYAEILITVGACFIVLLLVLRTRPKKNADLEAVAEEISVKEPIDTPAEEPAVVPVEEQDVPAADNIQVEKIELKNYEFEKDVEPISVKVNDNLDNEEKLKVAVNSASEQENLIQQIGNMGMKVCGNSDRLESVEIKIEKAQIIFKYRGDSAESSADISYVENSSDSEEKTVEEEPVRGGLSDEIGNALKKQAELENRKFGPGNMNVSHSGKVFSEEELEDLIK